jgi:glycosyltransferase involved in cell wall biosynthesis
MIGVAERAPSAPIRLERRSPLISVSHVITSLDMGGAELMLLRLLGAMDNSRFRNSVIVLCGEGAIGPRIRAMGVPVTAFGMTRLGHAVPGMIRLARELRRQRPDVIQTWLYHANLLGGFASLALPAAKLAWSIRCGRLNPAIERRTTILISRVCAAISSMLPARILCCSEGTFEAHVADGYAASKMCVIPNGFDTAVYRPEPRSRASLRDELGVTEDTLLAGLIARFHPTKDHETFFHAARIVRQSDPRVRFVLCGDGIGSANPLLARQIADSGLGAYCHLLGPRTDIPRIMAALDVAVLSSASEAFPNVLGEAMSCAIPCVSTDTGDSRLIVGDSGRIVPPRDSRALATAILDVLHMDSKNRAALGRRARQRIIDHFSLAAIAARYEQFYEELSPRCAA